MVQRSGRCEACCGFILEFVGYCVDLIMSTGVQLLGFLMCLGGWLLSFVSLVNDSWRTSTFSDQVITSVWYYQNLWQSCAEGSTGVTNCKQFESMLSLSGKTHTHSHTLFRYSLPYSYTMLLEFVFLSFWVRFLI